MYRSSHRLWILTGAALMMLAGLLFLLLLTDGESSEQNCSYLDILNHFNLTKNKEKFAMSRPVKNYKDPTLVTLDVLLYAILHVKEKDQELVPYVWIDMWWCNEFISWDPEQFCGMENFSVPTDVLWKPDVTIEEMSEKDKAPPSPYLIVDHEGDTELVNDQVMVTACRMHVYKFPFDIQNCNLSFKSAVYSDHEIQLVPFLNSANISERSRKLMRTQYEWLFVDMTVSEETVDRFGFTQSMIVYTITMKRRSALYIVNFMLPVLFFLFLDLASFMISDSGGEKLGFKITVLLAVTVMQLLLNEILPSSSNRIPLIAVYCIGIFGLMMLSLLETVFVMYLMRKDSKVNKADEDQSLSKECGNKGGKVSFHNSFRDGIHYNKQDIDNNKLIDHASVCDVSSGETAPELLSMAKESSNSQLMESHDFEKLTEELREVVKTLTLLLDSREEEGRKKGYWTAMTKKINKFFFVFYVMAISLFLLYMYFRWF